MNTPQPLQLDWTPPGDRCVYCNQDAYTCEHYEEPRTFDGEDAEEWQRLSERECDYTEIV